MARRGIGSRFVRRGADNLYHVEVQVQPGRQVQMGIDGEAWDLFICRSETIFWFLDRSVRSPQTQPARQPHLHRRGPSRLDAGSTHERFRCNIPCRADDLVEVQDALRNQQSPPTLKIHLNRLSFRACCRFILWSCRVRSRESSSRPDLGLLVLYYPEPSMLRRAGLQFLRSCISSIFICRSQCENSSDIPDEASRTSLFFK